MRARSFSWKWAIGARVLAGLVVCATAGVASAQDWTDDMDRPGFDYSNSVVRFAFECQAACQNDTACTAWTFNKVNKMCWLKNAYPRQVENSAATSGIIRGRIESADHQGAHTMAQWADVSLQDCEAACKNDSRCHQFTYDTAWQGRPREIGRLPNCWLHDTMGEPYRPSDTWTTHVPNWQCIPNQPPTPGCTFHDVGANYTYPQHLVSGAQPYTWCVPLTCSGRCGDVSDGCGAILHCGQCGGCQCTGQCGECDGQCGGSCPRGNVCSDVVPYDCEPLR